MTPGSGVFPESKPTRLVKSKWKCLKSTQGVRWQFLSLEHAGCKRVAEAPAAGMLTIHYILM